MRWILYREKHPKNAEEKRLCFRIDKSVSGKNKVDSIRNMVYICL